MPTFPLTLTVRAANDPYVVAGGVTGCGGVAIDTAAAHTAWAGGSCRCFARLVSSSAGGRLAALVQRRFAPRVSHVEPGVYSIIFLSCRCTFNFSATAFSRSAAGAMEGGMPLGKLLTLVRLATPRVSCKPPSQRALLSQPSLRL